MGNLQDHDAVDVAKRVLDVAVKALVRNNVPDDEIRRQVKQAIENAYDTSDDASDFE